MPMTYAEFKTYLSTFLWRDNDTVLSNNLDKLIRMADAELNRKLNIQRREVTVSITVTGEDHSLPSDFYQVISLSNLDTARQRKFGSMAASTFQHIMELREATNSTYIEPFYYAQRAASANTLFLVGPFSVTSSSTMQLQYRTAVPDYSTDDASWIEADYLDLYVYTVLFHAAVFTREEESIAFYKQLKDDAMLEALDEDARHVRFGGSPLHMKPTRHVPRRG